MRTFVAGLLTVGLVVAFASPSDAATKKRYRYENGYAQKYPYATPRQLQNARAYDRGGYYEQDFQCASRRQPRLVGAEGA